MTSISSIDFQHLVDNLQAGIYRSTPGPKAALLYANATMCKIFGISEKKLEVFEVKNIFNELKAFQAFNKKFKSSGLVNNYEVLLKDSKKKTFWASISGIAVKDEEGKLTEWDVIIHDISLRKEVEKELIESKELFQTIFDNTAAAIMVADKSERVIAWNPFTEKLLCMGNEELFNKPVKDLYPSQEWQKIRRLDIRSRGMHANIETKVYRENGSTLDVAVSVSILKDAAGDIVGSIGIMHDISERKLVHEMLIQSKLAAEEANQSKSLFLASMSHEVRTPMNAILGMIDLTLETHLEEEQRENLLVAKDAADNLLGLLNDILDLSRVESGKITLEDIEFHLHNVVNNVCKGLAVTARDKDLEILVEIEPDVPEIIMGDPVRLRQVLSNLINNAIKFTSKGKITTFVKVASKVKGGVVLLIAVKDQGIGIPKDRQERVFEVFTQADETTTRRFGGTGLGLAICKRLVEMMGGQIWVESEEGEGSTFNFTGRFKIVKGKKSGMLVDITRDGEKSSAEILKGRGIRLLLAEDNIVNQKIAVRILEKQGIEVETSVTGKEVIERIHKERFDLILMDSEMPELDGLEATKIIRENEKKTGQHIPIIAFTARAMQEDRKRCLDAGMDGYVTKPIDRKKLFEEILNCL
ncbi:sensory box histidine kinase/response regulator [hydrothermal vent metagenome]|uniref:histidine kinase n=1 Tax=hydrothermal vent metagenome TaxID=652676 RepID=A0A3B1DJB4_9ZZZZ